MKYKWKVSWASKWGKIFLWDCLSILNAFMQTGSLRLHRKHLVMVFLSIRLKRVIVWLQTKPHFLQILPRHTRICTQYFTLTLWNTFFVTHSYLPFPLAHKRSARLWCLKQPRSAGGARSSGGQTHSWQEKSVKQNNTLAEVGQAEQ